MARTFFAGAALDLPKRARVFTETDLECLYADGSASRGYGAGRPDCSDGSARPPLTLVDMSMDCAIRAAAPAHEQHTHRQRSRAEKGPKQLCARSRRCCVVVDTGVLADWLGGCVASSL